MRSIVLAFGGWAAALGFAVFPGLAGAQGTTNYPNKVVRFIVPFPPGSTADIIARLVGERLSDAWGKPVIAENRPGAGGIVGSDATAKSAPDGYTFLIVTVGHAVNPSLHARLPYDTEKAFAPVGQICVLPNIVAVHPSLPVNSLQDLIALARAKPRDLMYGSPGNGTTSHVATALLSQMAGIEMTHVPYNGQPAAENALHGGQIHLLINTIIGTMPNVRAGKWRALAVTTSNRSPLVPDLPTVAEAGFPGYEFQAWYVLLAPAGTPTPIIAKVSQDMNRVLEATVVKDRLTSLGALPVTGTPDELRAMLKSETERWAKVAKLANMKVD
jgi:tripartite-type tricarboxylate transporter receptor subunit TctC